MSRLPVLRRAPAALLAGVLSLALAGPPAAATLVPEPLIDTWTVSPKVARHGACSGPSSWRLRLVREEGRIKIRFEVSGGKADQRWNIFISDNGDRVFAGGRISGRNGSFVVRTATRDRDGTDTIQAGANNAVTGETCRGRASI